MSDVVLMMGGFSAEREVSMASGAAVQQSLEALGHQVRTVNDIQELKSVDREHIDVVFNILHGADGEDGRLAAWLASEGLPYTGCDHMAACLSWHKGVAKALVSQAGVKTPDSQLLKQPGDLRVDGDGPWIVKPASEGSSVGLHKVSGQKKLYECVNDHWQPGVDMLVEQFIKGAECTVGIVGEDVLPVVRIEPVGELYDYEAKYLSQQTAYHCPSGFDESVELALQADAMNAFEALGMSGWGRVDFIVDEASQPWFLEVNTTPGMTNNSLLPKAAAVYGWSFDDLVSRILATAELNHD